MSLEAKITYLDGIRFQVSARNHEITSDQPVENGGADTGMTPPEFTARFIGELCGVLRCGISSRAQYAGFRLKCRG